MNSFLGLDMSTQKLKAVLVDNDLHVIHESEVQFDTQLPEFRTHGGAIKHSHGVVTSPVLMWAKALDLLLDQIQLAGIDFSTIKALSGTAQQHGSVYWQKGARKTLANLDSSRFLHEQLQSCFSIKDSPIWMDSSTTEYCQRLEDAVGGPQKMAEITGSKTYERFTGSQIAKIADKRNLVYESCERISLVSSFLASLFVGDYVGIDYSDGSGMNLLDIRTKKWDSTCLKALNASNIETKLGQPIPSHSNIGCISSYYVERFGFNRECRVVSFTGDNPASFTGMCLGDNDIAVSLGTSDTVMLSLSEPSTFTEGHVLCSPISSDQFMGLLCFKNGSLTRERIRDQFADKSWNEFNRLLDSTPRGNFGNIGLYFDNQEILPFMKPGDYRWNSRNDKVVKFSSPEAEIRALIEGQFIARRAYAEDIGLKGGNNARIIATGGASCNKTILQVLSDVFNISVYVQENANSAVLGSAYLAKLGVEEDVSFDNIKSLIPPPQLVCTPNKDASQIYDPMVQRYRLLVTSLT